MILKEMYVMKVNVQIGEKMPLLPYQFAAQEKADADAESDEVNFKCIVKIIMPIGGSQSALFRYPKEGEKVLIGIEGSESYLMGYVPEAKNEEGIGQDDIFTDMKSPQEVKNGQILPGMLAGQFFRYKGPYDYGDKVGKDGDTIPDRENYSEIGFYNEWTRWKPQDAPAEDMPPKIDTLKIKSTGDINQKAVNHNQIKAKRFELLVNCDGGRGSDKESKVNFPLGDKLGDDLTLYAGDAHIRAKNRIVVKAEKEIVLEVGRSTITIDDEGIKLASKKSRNMTSGWDSIVSIDPLFGLTLMGQRILSRAYLGFELSDVYGGSVTSNYGVNRIEGMDIRLATLPGWNYIARIGLNALDGVVNAGLMASGLGAESKRIQLNTDTSPDVGDKIKKASMDFGISGSVLGPIVSTMGLRLFGGSVIDTATKKGAGYDLRDGMGLVVSLGNLVYMMMVIIRQVLEATLSQKTKRETSYARDGLYMALAVFEYGYALGACTALGVKNILALVNDCVMHFNGKDILMEAHNIKGFTVAKDDQNSITAGFSLKEDKPLVDETTLTKVLKKIGKGVGVVSLGAIAVAIGTGLWKGLSSDDAYYNELRSL